MTFMIYANKNHYFLDVSKTKDSRKCAHNYDYILADGDFHKTISRC